MKYLIIFYLFLNVIIIRNGCTHIEEPSCVECENCEDYLEKCKNCENCRQSAKLLLECSTCPKLIVIEDCVHGAVKPKSFLLDTNQSLEDLGKDLNLNINFSEFAELIEQSKAFKKFIVQTYEETSVYTPTLHWNCAEEKVHFKYEIQSFETSKNFRVENGTVTSHTEIISPEFRILPSGEILKK